MRLDGIIAVLMVLLAIVALVIWEMPHGKLNLGSFAGDHGQSDAAGGQDDDTPGAASVNDETAMLWAGQGDYSSDFAYNSTPWGPPTWH